MYAGTSQRVAAFQTKQTLGLNRSVRSFYLSMLTLLPCPCADPKWVGVGVQREVTVQMPPNLVTIITRDCNDFDLFPALSFFLLAIFVSVPAPQGHSRVQTLVKAVTLDSPLHLPPPLLPWQWTALRSEDCVRGQREPANG